MIMLKILTIAVNVIRYAAIGVICALLIAPLAISTSLLWVWVALDKKDGSERKSW